MIRTACTLGLLVLTAGCGPVVSNGDEDTGEGTSSSTGQATTEVPTPTGGSSTTQGPGSSSGDAPLPGSSGRLTTSGEDSSSSGTPIECESPLLDSEDWLQLADAPMRGNPDAFVTIVLWTGFNDPFSRQVQSTIDDLLAGPLGADVRIVSKQLPLDFQDPSGILARAGIAAHVLGSYWPFHDAMFAHEGEIDEAVVMSIAQEVGLDPDAFVEARGSDEVDAQLTADRTLFEALGGSGTPSWATNGLLSVGAQPLEVFEEAAAEELAAMEGLVDAGVPPCVAFELRLEERLP